MRITWQVCIGLILYAAALTTLAPLLVRRQSWYLHRPDRVLTVWFAALFSSLGALTAAMLLALTTLAADRDHLHGTRHAVITELSVWALLIMVGAAIALVSARAEGLLSASRQTRRDLQCLSTTLAYRTEERSGCHVTYLAADEPIACAVTGRSPEIFVSSGLESRLRPTELNAVIEHEIAHLTHRHSLTTYIADLAATTAPWIPASQELRRSTAVLIEFIADDHACGSTTHDHLVDALNALNTGKVADLNRVRIGRLTQPVHAATLR